MRKIREVRLSALWSKIFETQVMHEVISLARSSTGIRAQRRCGSYIVTQYAGHINDYTLYFCRPGPRGTQTACPDYVPIPSGPNQNGTTLFIHNARPASCTDPTLIPIFPSLHTIPSTGDGSSRPFPDCRRRCIMVLSRYSLGALVAVGAFGASSGESAYSYHFRRKQIRQPYHIQTLSEQYTQVRRLPAFP